MATTLFAPDDSVLDGCLATLAVAMETDPTLTPVCPALDGSCGPAAADADADHPRPLPPLPPSLPLVNVPTATTTVAPTVVVGGQPHHPFLDWASPPLAEGPSSPVSISGDDPTGAIGWAPRSSPLAETRLLDTSLCGGWGVLDEGPAMSVVSPGSSWASGLGAEADDEATWTSFEAVTAPSVAATTARNAGGSLAPLPMPPPPPPPPPPPRRLAAQTRQSVTVKDEAYLSLRPQRSPLAVAVAASTSAAAGWTAPAPGGSSSGASAAAAAARTTTATLAAVTGAAAAGSRRTPPPKAPSTAKPRSSRATKTRGGGAKRAPTARRTLSQKAEDFARISESYAATVMKQSVKKFNSPVPSRFCHVCGRKSLAVPVAACGNLLHGTCRKVICAVCFDRYGLDPAVLAAAIAGGGAAAGVTPGWKCPHCMDGCPDSASCRTYKRTNYLRHLTLRGKRMGAAAAMAAAAASSSVAGGGAKGGSPAVKSAPLPAPHAPAPQGLSTGTGAATAAAAAAASAAVAGSDTQGMASAYTPWVGDAGASGGGGGGGGCLPPRTSHAPVAAEAAAAAAEAAAALFGKPEPSSAYGAAAVPVAAVPPPPIAASPMRARVCGVAGVSPLDMRLVSRMLENDGWDGCIPASPVSPPPQRDVQTRLGLL
ncbi:hypothetical protein MMPV_001092 [Pyropia vietnamensis]